ncbi:hypothetical protein BC938DRAFT_472326 [Jimgerdemannia flammicorona]|uniref:Uncharacterized protein n=1 Tax=Jimgerdemannia flammicorona TaxID=994334 RepID=A0A433Q6B9_9FUNG|nr:hypothetical protein BC938DRAFT_472326 [Jimgerdemannia flammicorona]
MRGYCEIAKQDLSPEFCFGYRGASDFRRFELWISNSNAFNDYLGSSGKADGAGGTGISSAAPHPERPDGPDEDSRLRRRLQVQPGLRGPCRAGIPAARTKAAQFLGRGHGVSRGGRNRWSWVG